MKKILFTVILLICLIFAFTSSATGESEAFSFRNGITFGMTMEEVKNKEKEQPVHEDETSLFYYGQKAAGKDAKILYTFGELGLESIFVLFMDVHTNPNLFFDDYDDVYKALCEKYGEPDYPKRIEWKSDLFKEQSTDYGILVAMGHLQQWALWDFPEYELSLALRGENYKINHGLLYQWKEATEQEVDTSGI